METRYQIPSTQVTKQLQSSLPRVYYPRGINPNPQVGPMNSSTQSGPHQTTRRFAIEPSQQFALVFNYPFFSPPHFDPFVKP